MEDIDLAGVDPRRWGEARRRVAVLREWTAKRRHTRAEAVAAATSLGITPKHLAVLVSAWKKHGDVTRLSGFGMRRGAERGRRSLPADTRDAVMEAIAALGPDARFVEIEAEARRRCEQASTTPASFGMVHHLLMQARRRPATRGGASEVLVGEVACLLPTLTITAGIVSPTVVVAVATPETTVIAHRMLLPGEDRTRALRDVLAAVIDSRIRRPIVVAKRLAASMVVAEGVEEAGHDVRVATRSEILTKQLGGHIATLPIRHRWPQDGGSRASPDPATIDAPLNGADAAAAVGLAIQAHNLARTPSAVRGSD